MTIEERAEKGRSLKAAGACNCAQAVLLAFQDKISMNQEEIAKISAAFAAGMGGMEATCGALIGAGIAAGIITEGKGSARISKKVVQDFKESSGATICRDLKSPVDGKILTECPQCVYNAIIALGKNLSL